MINMNLILKKYKIFINNKNKTIIKCTNIFWVNQIYHINIMQKFNIMNKLNYY